MANSVHFIWTQYKISDIFKALKEDKVLKLTYNSEKTISIAISKESNSNRIRLINHFEGNHYLVSKRGLCLSMWKYYKSFNLDPFDAIPLTFPVRGIEDPMFKIFEQVYRKHEQERSNSVT